MQIRNGNLTLHVADDGDPSAPPILLLHGITSSVDTSVAAAGHLIHDEKSSRDWFRSAVVEVLDRIVPA